MDEGDVEYGFESLDELLHAYCVSVHKSQGSEFPAVVLPLLTQHYILLRRNLLYTGITRAKRLLVIVGTQRAVRIAVTNYQTSVRYSLLEQRLRG
jgi:exodeoxyribonuclease V alpha subunit